ncbi:MAG: ClpX C4-type zinc finger protein, partial [Planctomycetota bacterium]
MTDKTDNNKPKAICSFCGRPGDLNDMFIEGPNEVFICPECVQLCHNVIQENRRKFTKPSLTISEISAPKEIKAYLDEYV